MRAANLETLKLLLLNACIRQAKWVGYHLIHYSYPSSCRRDGTNHFLLYEEIDEKQVFNRVIDRKNSYF